MRRWIGFACGAAILCAAAWYFGRPNKAPVASPTTVAAVSTAPVESAPVPPPTVLDVIDLARAYEPVPEPDQVLPGGIDPATFIEEPSAPLNIPPAVELEEPDEDLLSILQATSSCFGWGIAMPERAETLLWELLSPSDMGPWTFYHGYSSGLEFMPRRTKGLRNQRVAVRGLPDSAGMLIAPFGLSDNLIQPELIDVMPREVKSDLARIRYLYGYRGEAPGRAVSSICIEPGTVSTVRLDVVPRDISTTAEPGQLQAWQESLAAWLIASWSGPTAYPRPMTESLKDR
jgi:hypothetical protein